MEYNKIKVKDVKFIESNALKRTLVWIGLRDSGAFKECYQEIDNGQLIRHCDDEGNEVILPEIIESEVIEVNVIPNFKLNV